MIHRFKYRIFRLRRVILITVLVGTLLIAAAWFVSHPYYRQSIPLGSLLIYAAIFFALFNMFQLILNPLAVGEILRITLAIGIAVFMLAAVSRIGDFTQLPTSKSMQFAILTGFLVFWVMAFEALRILVQWLDAQKGTTAYINQNSLFIDTTAEHLFDMLSISGSSESWTKSVEKISGAENRYLTYYRSYYWNEGSAEVALRYIPITTDVILEEENVSQTVVLYDDEMNVATNHCFTITPEGNGVRFAYIQELQTTTAWARFSYWLTDYFADFHTHMKEVAEGVPPISIYGLDHRPYFTEWLAKKTHRPDDDENSDQSGPWG